MTAVFILAIIFGGTILLLITVGLLIIGIIKARKTGGFSKKEKLANAEETRMIQEVYHGLSRMEERVEALETILIERQREEFRK